MSGIGPQGEPQQSVNSSLARFLEEEQCEVWWPTWPSGKPTADTGIVAMSEEPGGLTWYCSVLAFSSCPVSCSALRTIGKCVGGW